MTCGAGGGASSLADFAAALAAALAVKHVVRSPVTAGTSLTGRCFTYSAEVNVVYNAATKAASIWVRKHTSTQTKQTRIRLCSHTHTYRDTGTEDTQYSPHLHRRFQRCCGCRGTDRRYGAACATGTSPCSVKNKPVHRNAKQSGQCAWNHNHKDTR